VVTDQIAAHAPNRTNDAVTEMMAVRIIGAAPVILARLDKKSELRNVYWLALF
jgi:hypothetical protein